MRSRQVKQILTASAKAIQAQTGEYQLPPIEWTKTLSATKLRKAGRSSGKEHQLRGTHETEKDALLHAKAIINEHLTEFAGHIEPAVGRIDNSFVRQYGYRANIHVYDD